MTLMKSKLLSRSKAPAETLHDHVEDVVSIEQIKRTARERKLRAIRSLAARIQVAPDGSRTFVRFSQSQCFEHYILMATFGSLALTGLLQTFSRFALIGWIIQALGGIEALRTVHHLAAAGLALQSVYHVAQILVTWFVKRERGGMWPAVRDFRNLAQTVMFNVGLAKQKPESDRYNTEEKLEYWALLWGTPIMGITGFILWFPTIATLILPGEVVPVAQAIHSWEAVLATLAILTWHMYHTNIKEKNRSIFTGTMTEEEMQHAHPLEYRRILAADKYLRGNGSGDGVRGGDGRGDAPDFAEIVSQEASHTT
jgi:cytochrome b subunit of formate dehydrogenase